MKKFLLALVIVASVASFSSHDQHKTASHDRCPTTSPALNYR